MHGVQTDARADAKHKSSFFGGGLKQLLKVISHLEPGHILKIWFSHTTKRHPCNHRWHFWKRYVMSLFFNIARDLALLTYSRREFQVVGAAEANLRSPTHSFRWSESEIVQRAHTWSINFLMTGTPSSALFSPPDVSTLSQLSRMMVSKECRIFLVTSIARQESHPKRFATFQMKARRKGLTKEEMSW